MKDNMYFIYATEKTTNNTPISPMHITPYHSLSHGGYN
jgi:hypothetical protein